MPTLPQALAELVGRLNLQGGPGEVGQGQVLEGSVAVLDVLALAGQPGSDGNDLNLSGGAGTHTVARTVPAGKTWRLTFARRAGSAANSQITIQQFGQGAFREIPLTNAGTGAEVWNGEVWLGPGSTVGMYTTGNAGDTGIGLRFCYVEYPWGAQLPQRT